MSIRLGRAARPSLATRRDDATPAAAIDPHLGPGLRRSDTCEGRIAVPLWRWGLEIGASIRCCPGGGRGPVPQTCTTSGRPPPQARRICDPASSGGLRIGRSPSSSLRSHGAQRRRYFIRTSSSAIVGCSATVSSNCALVRPAFTAIAAACRISGTSGPIMCSPTMRPVSPSQTIL